jgi:hypothetical protein
MWMSEEGGMGRERVRTELVAENAASQAADSISRICDRDEVGGEAFRDAL